MAVYDYTALNSSGKKVKGVIDADSVRAARQKLKQQGIFPTSLVEARAKQEIQKDVKQLIGGGRVSLGQLTIATRQLATLVGAGIPLVEALRALTEQIDHAALKSVVSEVSDRVNEGSTLADAMRHFPKVFPRLYPNMIAAGEASGTLELVLERLAELSESQLALRRKVLSALSYPILMLTLCLGVVVLLLAFVVPQLTSIFEEHKAALPLPTQVVIGASNFIQNYWMFLMALGLAGGMFFVRYRKTEAGRERLDTLKLRLPLLRAMTIRSATASFARTLGTMLASGVELLSALSIVKNIVGNVVLERAIEKAMDGVRDGRSLAHELERSQVFPRLLVRMVAVGEKTGQLEPMLLRAATSYESEMNALVSGLTAILNPILILFLASVVGMILISVMLPMLEMTSLVG